MTIILATHNQGKAREFARLLDGVSVKTLADCGVTDIPEETGSTFLENARIKARAAMKAIKSGPKTQTGAKAGPDICHGSYPPVLADDSGLCVEALEGVPGVLSARFGGFSSSAEQIAHLLRQMEGETNRAAAFVCRLVLLYPDGREVLAEGRCEGEIAQAPRGDGGFGYDPVFFVPEKNRTMAELPPEEKDALSHRGDALRKLLENLS